MARYLLTDDWFAALSHTKGAIWQAINLRPEPGRFGCHGKGGVVVTWAGERCWKLRNGRYAIRLPQSRMKDVSPAVMFAVPRDWPNQEPKACRWSIDRLLMVLLIRFNLKKRSIDKLFNLLHCPSFILQLVHICENVFLLIYYSDLFCRHIWAKSCWTTSVVRIRINETAGHCSLIICRSRDHDTKSASYSVFKLKTKHQKSSTEHNRIISITSIQMDMVQWHLQCVLQKVKLRKIRKNPIDSAVMILLE